MDTAAGTVGIDADAGPEGFVEGFGLLHELHDAAALADALLAELASGGDVQCAVFIGDGIKGAELHEGFCLFGGDEILMNHKFAHGESLLHEVSCRLCIKGDAQHETETRNVRNPRDLKESAL